jgi:hypothetical protein
MLGKLRAGLSQVGGSRVILATLAIAWGLNQIQKVVDEQTMRLAALAQAENDIMNRAAEFAAFNSDPDVNPNATPEGFEKLFDMDAGEENN